MVHLFDLTWSKNLSYGCIPKWTWRHCASSQQTISVVFKMVFIKRQSGFWQIKCTWINCQMLNINKHVNKSVKKIKGKPLNSVWLTRCFELVVSYKLLLHDRPGSNHNAGACHSQGILNLWRILHNMKFTTFRLCFSFITATEAWRTW